MAPPREPMFQCWRHWAFIVLLGLLNAVLGGATNISSDRLLLPIVVNTWPFTNATDKAWEGLMRGSTSIDSVVMGCSLCERQQCDGSVGYGGHPDETSETTLDAMVMDGVSQDVGAVGDLRRIKDAIAVARAVMKYTKHTMIVGDAATQFAIAMGFQEGGLHTNASRYQWKHWRKNDCQPNYRQNVNPDPKTSCGPYTSRKTNIFERDRRFHRHKEQIHTRPPIGPGNHDTIGMLVVDHHGNIAAGTSTNGASHKVPGRVGDSPIAGAGTYVDNIVGGAAATGDGDVMMRFLPSFLAVELMRGGKSPSAACKTAIARIAKPYPNFSGALVAVTVKGQHGAACHGLVTFTYSVRSPNMTTTTKYTIKCSRPILHDHNLHNHDN